MRLSFELLGEVGAHVDGRAVSMGPARQRCVLAALLVDANRAVSSDQLVDRVWGDCPPQRAAGTLQSYLSRLRAALPVPEECTILRRSGGYLISVDEAAVDLHRFRALLAQARESGDDQAATLYERALGLWQGEALADLDTLWVNTLRHALHAERFAARLDFHDVQLRRGQSARLLVDLPALAAAHPLDERLAGQLMLALYREGRQAEALAHYERVRRQLAEELGADPSPALRQLHQQILAADSAVASPSDTPALVPRHLPARPALFTGRAAELAELDRILSTSGEKETTLVISAIGGSGGVGKTWLALHWAHRHADAFPDGQLYADLRGFDPSDAPVQPEAAVRTFLDALAVDPARIPAELEAQAALYRTLVAEKRMLIVLDNARDTAQVVPLLPGGSSCAVLVTSRRQLTDLVTRHGARSLTIDVLNRAEAHQVLVRHLGAARAGAEPESVRRLLHHCAGLPLALGIVAARATMRPQLPLSALADELGEDSARLNALDAGESDLRAVFSWSYRALTPQAARVFRLLGIHPGPDVAESAAAALAGLTPAEVRPLLAELTRAHLITERTYGRYVFHDLLRAYATEKAHAFDTAVERHAASHRLLDHYLHTAHASALLLYPDRHPIALASSRTDTGPVVPGDHREALAWFTAEHQTLTAAVRYAADKGFGTHAWQLAWTLVTYLDQQGHWRDLLATHHTALAAAECSEDPLGQAHAHAGLARAYVRLRHHEGASASLESALDLFTKVGDRIGQANTHRGIAWLLESQGRYREALDHVMQAHDLYEKADHRAGLAHALNAVAWYHSLLGNHRDALAPSEQALALHRETGHLQGQAAAWDTLGHAHHHLGDHTQALTCYAHSLQLFTEAGDRYNEAATLIRLGDTHRDASNDQAARRAWQAALDILGEFGHAMADEVKAKLTELPSD
jgi:DNA-binding SARP family transcriptional activator